MIFIGKAPYRISLLGGGSDLNWFVNKKNYGVCFGYSLRKYSYSVLNILPSTASKGILEYSTKEEYFSISDIVHPIVREVLKELEISKFIELKTFGFASGGAGLGGSSCFLLSLLSSLSKGFNLGLSETNIIENSCNIEINKLKKPIGKQDHYLCGNSGLNSFTFFDNDSVNINKISENKKKVLERLINNFYLIPTNKTRSSELILSKMQRDNDSIDKLTEIRKIAEDFIAFEDNRDYKIEEEFNKAIKNSWIIKKTMAEVMNDNLNEQFEMINKLIPNNWIRLLGAGSGGYFLISSKIKEDQMKSILENNKFKGAFKAEISNEGISSFQL